MHPEIVQDHPGSCPKCGMALEATTVEAQDDTSELDDKTRRLKIGALFAFPVFLSAMAAEFWPEAMARLVDPNLRQWLEMLLSAPAVIWCGWVFYERRLPGSIVLSPPFSPVFFHLRCLMMSVLCQPILRRRQSLLY